MRPDLSDPQQRAAYQQELRAVASRWRLAGFILVCAGAAALVYAQYERLPELGLRAALMALGAGWVLLLTGIILRLRHHRRRMAE
ncbi:MAG TPA: hypothetical protein VFZ91_07995 [Allosphingosinicella sp.]